MTELVTRGKAQTNIGEDEERGWDVETLLVFFSQRPEWSSWCMRIKIPNNWAPLVAQW